MQSVLIIYKILHASQSLILHAPTHTTPSLYRILLTHLIRADILFSRVWLEVLYWSRVWRLEQGWYGTRRRPSMAAGWDRCSLSWWGSPCRKFCRSDDNGAAKKIGVMIELIRDQFNEAEWGLKLNSLFGDSGHRGPCSPHNSMG